MIFVDTTVWIEFFRGNSVFVKGLSEKLDTEDVALTTPVLLELLSGARKAELAPLKRVLSALPQFMPTKEEWELCEKWISQSRQAGYSFGVLDLLIAAITRQNNGVLWSLDKDFRFMDKLGFVELFR